MDGLHHLANPGSTVTIGGKTYTLSRAVGTLSAYAEIEAEICRRRNNPLKAVAEAIEAFPESFRETVIKAGVQLAAQVKPRATRAEVAEFVNTLDGVAFMFWVAARAAHPEEVSTFAAALAIVGALAIDESDLLKGRLDAAAGLDDLKNSTGRAAAEAVSPAETETVGQPPTIVFPGPESIAS